MAIPPYGDRVSEIAISYLQQMSGGGARTVLIAIYGNRAYENTLLELCDTLADASFYCIAAIAAVVEHSIMHQFATEHPDEEDARELAVYAKKIRQNIETRNLLDNLILPRNKPYRKYSNVPMKLKAGKVCKKCGLCAVKCPVGAIPSDNPMKIDDEKCISYMRCITICPNNARSVSKLILTVATQKIKKVCDCYKRNELFL